MRDVSEHQPPVVRRVDLSRAGSTPAVGRSHETVQTALARLANTPFPPLQQVSCECDRGVLTLRGRVPTFYLKQVAQETVRSISGLRQVINEIQVGG